VTGSVAAILLAAGKSCRMGSCKQLLPLGDRTVIARCLETLVASGVDEIIVVVSPEGHEVADAARKYPVRIVVNPESEGDMASSVRAGRDALKTEASGVIVFLCDCPLVSSNTIASLIVEHGDLPESIIIPCRRERRGHPLLFPRSILNELANDLILRDLVRRFPERICCIDVDDPGVLLDMDTPEDYHRISGMVQASGENHNKSPDAGDAAEDGETICRSCEEKRVEPDSKNPLKRWRLSHPDAFAGRCDYVEAASFALLGCIGGLDYITGYEFGFFIFYFIPVAVSSWYCGRRLGLQVAFGSAIVWYLSDKFTHHPYSNAYFIYWEMFMRLLSFLTTTMTISRIRTMVLNEERILGELLSVRQELDGLKQSHDVSQSHTIETFSE
jgi:molybdenum cofactor cytidylyltransferase